MKLKNEMGTCPFCGSDDLDYGAVEWEDTLIYYPWTCNNCKREGQEWYNLEFAGQNVLTENGDSVEVEEINYGHYKGEV